MMLALALAAAAACPIDRTVYRLHGAPRFEAGFARTRHPSDMASDLRLFLRTPKHIYWFAFTSANGLGGTGIAPDLGTHAPDEAAALVVDPDSVTGHGIDFDAFAANDTAFDRAPQGRDRAPARLFSRELRWALWYEPVDLAGGDRRAVQEAMPIGFFEPAGCDARPH